MIVMLETRNLREKLKTETIYKYNQVIENHKVKEQHTTHEMGYTELNRDQTVNNWFIGVKNLLFLLTKV